MYLYLFLRCFCTILQCFGVFCRFFQFLQRFTKENAGELSEYGFDKPGNIITFTTAEGTKTLTIGMENPVTGQYYVKIDGEDTLYLVSGSFPSVFSKSLEELKETTEDTEALQDSTKATVFFFFLSSVISPHARIGSAKYKQQQA